jgi:hypothetical protein
MNLNIHLYNMRDSHFNEFILFIQSIGFVYSKHLFGKEYYLLDQYEMYITISGIYCLTEKVQQGVTRTLTTGGVQYFKNDLNIFRSIIRDKKLNDLGI